ncbi:hypothetical protein [Winogradskyella flava]|uniref:hypothetical protein n=1 Tax=Winogradskyella flava TaxID=1884876 RepID=UPI0024918238|nr:hypothetical protein [Winogradskyella flava]
MKNLLNLGKALNKAEQKQVFGGTRHYLTHAGDESGGGCSYEHHDVCTDGTSCDPFDFDACRDPFTGASAGCGHWVKVC